jgi:hypothetical protein
MLGRLRMSIDETIAAYQTLTKMVFAKPKYTTGEGKFSASKLQNAIRAVIRPNLGDADAKLLDASVCKTCVSLLSSIPSI